MTLSEHGWNAIMTMATLATHVGAEALRLKDIRAQVKVSRPYMERTLAKLRQAGLVEGIRGTGGGYYLSKPAHQITLAEIVTAAESPEPHAQWLDMQPTTVEQLVTQEIWREMDNKLHGLLSSVTLGSLLHIEQRRPSYKPGLTARLIAKMFPPRLPETGMAY